MLSCPITRWQRNAFKKPNQKRNTQFKAFSYLSFKNNSALASYLHICGWRWDSHDDVTNKSTCLRCSPAPFLSMVLLANSVFCPPCVCYRICPSISFSFHVTSVAKSKLETTIVMQWAARAIWLLITLELLMHGWRKGLDRGQAIRVIK